MKKYLAGSLNHLASKIIIDLLYQNGIVQFFISPGSRSTPLTSAAAENEKVNKIVHFDERGAAFAALGCARATGKPAVLICTSGTAVANYYPALIEASNDRVPMIILSADRPPELQGVNANQTIDQQDIFGSYPLCFINLEPPDESQTYFSNLISAVSDAVTQSILNPNGPVHINCMFREPLAPLEESIDFTALIGNLMEDRPHEPFDNKSVKFENKLNYLTNVDNILLTIGYLKNQSLNPAILNLAEKYNLPIMADIRSGLRVEHPNVITYFDQILLSNNFNQLDDLTVVHLGGNLISKRYLEFIERSSIKQYLHFDSASYTYNPHHKTTAHYCMPLENIIDVLDTSLSQCDKHPLAKYQKANEVVKHALSTAFEHESRLNEINITRVLSQAVTKENVLFLGSSMPVRDYDMYADSSGVPIPITANRGASGIDGSLAAALGFAIGYNKKGIALLGDLAFLHDLNSLSLVKKSKQPLMIVVINNDGGGIFSFLPVANCDKIFEPYFGTPHGYSFKSAAQLFELEYKIASTAVELCEALEQFNMSGQSLVVEIKSNRDENIKLHHELAAIIKDKLS